MSGACGPGGRMLRSGQRRELRAATRLLGPRAADLGSPVSGEVQDVVFVVALATDAPVAAPPVCGTHAALPFQSGAFTGVLAPAGADAREVLRVLQPGGVAVLVDADAAAQAAFTAAGFAVKPGVAGVAVARKAGGSEIEIPRQSLLSLFIPRRWLERRRVT